MGGTTPIRIDIRVISTSKVELKDLVKRNRFSSDLFCIINGVPIRIHRLTERSDDIPLLIEFLLNKFTNKKELKVSKSALVKLIKYSWPGNICQLRNEMQLFAIFAEIEIKVEYLVK